MEGKERLKEFLGWIIALQKSMESSVSNEDPKNVWKYEGYKTFARKYNQIVQTISKEIKLPPIVDLYDLDKIPSPYDTIAIQQKDIYLGVHANVGIIRAFLENKIGIIEDKITELNNFIQSKLRAAQIINPDSERDVQNTLEQIFIGHGFQKGIDYDRETGRVKVSAKEVIPDFIFQKFDLAIEVKFIKDKTRVKNSVDEINADIMSYTKKYKRVFFIVYDMGFIRDEIEYKQDITKEGVIDVIIVKN